MEYEEDISTEDSTEEDIEETSHSRLLIILSYYYLLQSLYMIIRIGIIKDMSLYENPMGLSGGWLEILFYISAIGFNLFFGCLFLLIIREPELHQLVRIQSGAIGYYMFSILAIAPGDFIPYPVYIFFLITRLMAALMIAGIETYVMLTDQPQTGNAVSE